VRFFARKIAPLLKPSLKNTLKYLRTFEETQWLSRGELEELQQEKLVKLCRHFNIKDVKDLDDLKNLPLTSKETMRGYIIRRIPSGRRPIPQATSGTTGVPLKFFSDDVELTIKHALALRGWQWTGWKIGEKAIDFIVHEPPKFPKSIYHRLTGWLHLYALEGRDVYEKKYARTIRRYKPKLIRGYPSFLADLADILTDKLEEKIIAVVHGETPQPYMDRLLKAYNVYNTYGLGECQSVAFECEYHNLHVSMESCIVEEVNGELVITNLDNYVQPFIRYRTGDLGSIKVGKCKCGRELQIISPIIGRVYEVYRAPTGRIVHPFYFGLEMRKYLKYVKEYQVLIYPADNLIEIRVVPTKYYKDNIIPLDNMEKLFGMKIIITTVDNIERLPSGKKLLVRIIKN